MFRFAWDGGGVSLTIGRAAFTILDDKVRTLQDRESGFRLWSRSPDLVHDASALTPAIRVSSNAIWGLLPSQSELER
jgi:hypothetical protein